MTTRAEFRDFMTTTFDELLSLFNDRNGSYGSGEDAHHNFFETGRRIVPLLTRVAEEYKQTGAINPGLAAYVSWFCLQDKHQVALTRGPGVSEGSQRIMDEIVYNLLALPWFLEAEKQDSRT